MSLYEYQQEIVQKTKTAILNGYKHPCIVSPCGSGKSYIISHMVKGATDKGNRVLFLVHRKELKEQIEEDFEKFGVNPDLLDIYMVQTATNRLDKIKCPKMIVTDENHHSMAKTYRDIYEAFPDATRIGFTATPIRLDGKGLGDINDILIEGPSVKWLIENNFLAPYKYYAPRALDTHDLKKRAGEYTKASIDKAMSKGAIFGDVIGHYKKLAPGQQAICYCHSVSYSMRIAKYFTGAGISAKHISADTPKDKREEIIEDFRSGKIKILCNVDLIGEGFNVPDCSCVILLRPTASLSLYIQQAMRCMRYKKGKVATIIDHVGNVERHNLPDTPHEWSLEGEKVAKRDREKGEVSIKICPECFSANPSKCSLCLQCGAELKAEEKELEEIKDVELEEVKTEFVVDYREPKDCKSMGELYDLAKNRGYKPGWAYYQGKILGYI